MTNSDEKEDEDITVSSEFFRLLILGVTLIFVGIIVLAVASFVFGGQISSSVVIFIGPFPIVFGSGPGAIWLILIALIIAAYMMKNHRMEKLEL
jgi:uncharacterized membrane protein